jgi:hypothetical protein
MRSSTEKQLNEQAAFMRFIDRMGDKPDWTEVTSRPEPEPDLLCRHVQRGEVAFELVSLTDPRVAKVQAAGPKASTSVFYTADPSERIVRNKLHKNYVTNVDQLELLIYTDGQIITPDDIIIPTIEPLFDAIDHPFKRVWFMGEFKTCSLWAV